MVFNWKLLVVHTQNRNEDARWYTRDSPVLYLGIFGGKHTYVLLRFGEQIANVRQHETILRKANDQACLNSTLFARHKLTAYINKTLLNLTTIHFQSSFRWIKSLTSELLDNKKRHHNIIFVFFCWR